jgi:phage gp45-like
MLARAVARGIIDSPQIQLVKLDLGGNEVKENVERLQPYGLSTFPPSGGQAIVAFISGNREHPICLVVDDGATRAKVLDGEVILYSKHGNQVKLKSAGKISIGVGTEDLNPLTGVVNGEALDAFTGLTQFALGNASSKVFVRKS